MPNPTEPSPDAPEQLPQVAPVEMPVERAEVLSLATRVARIQQEMQDMPRDKSATIPMKKGGSFTFDYISKSALMHEARKVFGARGVAVLISERSIEQVGNRCCVTLDLTLTCDTGETLTVTRSAYGNADDDKGPQKASTTAARIMLADLLLQGGDDHSEEDSVDFRPDVAGQAAQTGDLLATTEQLKFATDLIYRTHLDKAMPTAAHALVRLARPVALGEIAPGVDPNEAIHVIPRNVMHKLIERLEKVTPTGAGAVWESVAKWETDNGYGASVEAEDTAPKPVTDADGNEIPF